MSDDFAPAWRPEPGDTITGKAIRFDEIDPKGKGLYPVITIEKASGDMESVHAFHAVLQSELGRREPKLGDELTITYLGLKQGKVYKYESYKVIGGQEREMNWKKYAPADGSSEPPIPNDPLPRQPSLQEKAQESFGDKAPF
jgi:hypothetical protein